ncbi:hypothetical protein JV173_04320 [Acholeplasma equirhinis]|uniref:hypothetical protein n=1 Tax=Acholeplasma equirhinis TaxID=555393 RepID=UPI00197AD032|nr:hypothetical protein [Acholeplasma equirhinis]MBN3490735.1 hypothetical protein [Acholeplasma equirhinis]
MLRLKTNKNTEQQRVGKPYFIDKFATVKAVHKIGFLKFWVAGVSYFLAFMTVEASLRSDMLDQLFILAILMGLLTEYVTNKFIYYMHRADQDTYQFLPFRANQERNKLVSLLLTFLYVIIMIGEAMILHTIVVELFNLIGIPTLGWLLHGEQKSLDPISFGFYVWLLDLIWYKGRKELKKETT